MHSSDRETSSNKLKKFFQKLVGRNSSTSVILESLNSSSSYHQSQGQRQDYQVKITKKENISTDGVEKKNVLTANMGASVYLQNDDDILHTYYLASCYGIIVIGEREDGTKIAGINHWIGDEVRAADQVSKLKTGLIARGAQNSSFKCFAIGGHTKSPDVTKEINELVEDGTLENAICDLSKNPGESTRLIVTRNRANEILIDYSVHQFEPQHTISHPHPQGFSKK
ncbi:hypothetical protein [Legionella israelensis]|uniref:Uncharacterized protein n=1 Tax=Legionella israelensis TaxID=454 RepID=A0A0W0WK68_9GAMM|nr:hypothetical protein [Legionella israelensis]KTD32708.1 hypothetical protein Lisr_0380 [Legionella israelensis]QBS08990.1 hypothetical protein E4T55_03425 [Legionella israelensis]SCY35780.1 hypothetical protein SAMN02746069_02168 [Legionella israelensis DSM 19235]STX58687.1 Uncharacterised protein [Legionella israelensis]